MDSLDSNENSQARAKTLADPTIYRLLIENVQDYAIFFLDAEGYIRTWNKGAERAKGYKATEIIGQHFSIFYSQADKDDGKPERELRIAKKLGSIEDEDWRIRKDGTRFWANVVITALFRDDVLVGFAKVTRNLTERKHHEDELRGANNLLRQQQDELRSLNASKDEFVALASHQLRTPATAVKMILGSVLDELYGPLEPHLQAILQKAYDSNERQIHIVNNLLRVAQIDAGQVVLRLAPAGLAAMLAEIIDEQQKSIAERGQTTSVECEPNLTAEVDKQNFQMAVANLVDNASKYSRAGTIIRVSAARKNGGIVISVQDEGVGIAPDDLDLVFSKFQRFHNDVNPKVTGSGLGLYWTKRIVDLHGGTITVKSKLGEGTVFQVKLPRKGQHA